MSYLDNKIPTIRELRHPETSLAHGDGHFRGLGGRGCAAVSSRADRSFTQGSICPLLPALGIMCSLPDTVVLLHGAVGCGTCASGNNANIRAGNAQRGTPGRDALWLSTALDELNVINGGNEKLAEAIVEADRAYKPKIILAVSGCLPGVIGDDIDSVAARTQERVGARILPVHCEGFKSRFMATAYDVVYHALGRGLMPDPAEAPAKDPLTVNVMNVGSMGLADEKELSRLLGRLGLKTNFLPVFTDPESFKKSAAAALSISVCPTHDDYFLTHLKEKYGVPHVIRHMPVGVKNTSSWVVDAGRAMGLEDEAKKVVSEEEKELKSALGEFSPVLKGKTAFLSAGEYRSLATASLLKELGLRIVGIRSFHFDEFAEVEIKKLAKGKQDFVYNVANVQPFEEANILAGLKPDVFLGHWHGNSTAARLGIPTQVMYNSGHGYMGYAGAYDLARRLARRVGHPEFYRRLGRHGRLPYKASWYQSDPFSRIRRGGGTK